MKRITFVLLYAALGVAASAQTIWVRTNEISGNVSPSESLTAVAGAIRLTVYSTDGGGSADLSGTAVRFLITDLRDDKVIVSNSPAVVVTNSVHRGEATLSAGSPYAVRLMAYPEGNDPYALYWATLTVTNPPSAGGASVSITSTSVVDIGNLTVQWEIQGDGDLAPDGTDRTISPHTDLGASLGRTNERYDEAHVRAGYFENLQAGTVSVEYAIGFLDNTKVKLTGETNTVDLTTASVQARSPTNDNEVATMGYVDSVAGGAAGSGATQLIASVGSSTATSTISGAILSISNAAAAGESVVKNIASYTYTGGEASVTLSFDPLYNPVFVSLTGEYVGDGGTNINSGSGIYYGVNINGKTNGYRVAFVYNSYHVAYPTAPIADLTQKYLRLQNVPGTNHAANAYFGIQPLSSGASWEFLASPRGVSCFGRGFSISMNMQEYGSFYQVGSLSTNDYVNRNFITQLVFAAYAATSGVQYVARSNAVIRVWGVTQ